MQNNLDLNRPWQSPFDRSGREPMPMKVMPFPQQPLQRLITPLGEKIEAAKRRIDLQERMLKAEYSHLEALEAQLPDGTACEPCLVAEMIDAALDNKCTNCEPDSEPEPDNDQAIVVCSMCGREGDAVSDKVDANEVPAPVVKLHLRVSVDSG